MTIFRDLYFLLFAAGADALEALEQGDAERAKKVLTEAHQKAEEVYLDAGED